MVDPFESHIDQVAVVSLESIASIKLHELDANVNEYSEGSKISGLTLSLGREVAQSAPLEATMVPDIFGPETVPPLIGRMTLVV